MTSTQFVLLFFVLCGISIYSVLGQMGVFTGNSAGVDNPVDQIQPDATQGNHDFDDEDDDDDDVMSRLGQVESIEDFVALLQHDGRQVTTDDIYNEEQDGKMSISGGGRLAVPDSCSPRNTTIRINMEEETDSETTFFPRCTKIERCGGCCSSPNLECVPRYTERVSLKVVKGRVPYPGAPHLQYTGFASVIVDRHVTCRVNCKLTAESCGPKKDFSRRKCDCKCKTQTPCPPPTVWDSDDCSCQCPRVTECCNVPNCGMVWNPSTCQCQLNNDGRLVIAADVNRTGHQSGDASSHTTPEPTTASTTSASTSTTTTTTTTSATTTPFDPCLTLRCHRRFIKVRSGNTCRCAPNRNRTFRQRG